MPIEPTDYQHNLQKVYNMLREMNQQFTVGFDDFYRDMQDSTKLRKVHTYLSDNVPNFTVDFDTFYGDMYPKTNGKAASQDTTMPSMTGAELESKAGEQQNTNTPEESGWGFLGAAAQKGAAALNSMIARTPETLIRAYNIIPNTIADVTGIESFRAPTPEQYGLGDRNKLAKSWEDNADYWEQKANERNSRYKDGVVGALSGDNPDWGAAGLNLLGGIIESSPSSIAMMLTAPMGTGAMITSGAAMFGAGKLQEIDKIMPDMPEGKKVAVAISNGALEGLFETFLGSGAVGKAFTNIIKEAGEVEGKKIIKKSVADTFAKMIQETPALAPLGEGLEEVGTQIAQNAIDKYSGLRPEINLTDGAGDAFLIGLGMGAGMGGGLALTKKIVGGEQKTVVEPKNPAAIAEIQQRKDENKAKKDIEAMVSQSITDLTHEDGKMYTGITPDGERVFIISGDPVQNSIESPAIVAKYNENGQLVKGFANEQLSEVQEASPEAITELFRQNEYQKLGLQMEQRKTNDAVAVTIEQGFNELRQAKKDQTPIEYNGRRGLVVEASTPKKNVTVLLTDPVSGATNTVILTPEKYGDVLFPTPDPVVTPEQQAQTQQQVQEAQSKVINVTIGKKQTPFDYREEDGRVVLNQVFATQAEADKIVKAISAEYPNIKFEAVNTADPKDKFARNNFVVREVLAEQPTGKTGELPQSIENIEQLPAEQPINAQESEIEEARKLLNKDYVYSQKGKDNNGNYNPNVLDKVERVDGQDGVIQINDLEDGLLITKEFDPNYPNSTRIGRIAKNEDGTWVWRAAPIQSVPMSAESIVKDLARNGFKKGIIVKTIGFPTDQAQVEQPQEQPGADVSTPTEETTQENILPGDVAKEVINQDVVNKIGEISRSESGYPQDVRNKMFEAYSAIQNAETISEANGIISQTLNDYPEILTNVPGQTNETGLGGVQPTGTSEQELPNEGTGGKPKESVADVSQQEEPLDITYVDEGGNEIAKPEEKKPEPVKTEPEPYAGSFLNKPKKTKVKTEPKPQKDLSDERHNRLVDLVRSYNDLTPAKKRRQEGMSTYSRISTIASDFGYTISQDGKQIAVKKDGKPIKKIAQKTSADEIQAHKLLSDYPQDVQDFVNVMINNPGYLAGADVLLSKDQKAQAIKNIIDGKKTVAANQLLDALEGFFNSNSVDYVENKLGKVNRSSVTVQDIYRMQQEDEAELTQIESDMSPQERETYDEHINNVLQSDENFAIFDSEDWVNLFSLNETEFNDYFNEKYRPVEETKTKPTASQQETKQTVPGSSEDGGGEGKKSELTRDQKLAAQQKKVDDLSKQYGQAEKDYVRLNNQLQTAAEHGGKGQADIFGNIKGSDVIDFGQGDKEAKDAVNAANKKATQLRQQLSEETIKLNELKKTGSKDVELFPESTSTPPPAETFAGKILDEKPDRLTSGKSFADAINKPVQKIEDFGEKIEGAKKDQIKKYFDKINMNGRTLSTIFPKPDIKQLIESGLSVKDAAAIKVAHEFATQDKKKGEEVIKFYAAYAKSVLAESINLEFKNERYVFTDYGKSQITLRTQAYEKVAKELGNEFLELDLTKVAIKELDENYKKYLVNKHDDANYMVRYYVSATKYFKDLKDAMVEFVDQVKANTTKNTVQYKHKINLYQDVRNKEFFIGYKKSGEREPIRLRDGIKTLKDASDYKKEHEAELQLELDRILTEQRKDRKPAVRLKYTNETARDRVGKDWRNGKNVDSKEFAETFGFRGVEFGNWVNQKERQVFMNNSYDSFMDLAQILNIPPSAISLGGNLAISFGSRGSGAAAAHYEPGRKIINLTKTQGLGSLAHEWYHAIDSYFAGFENNMAGMKSATSKEYDKDSRKEIKDAFDKLYDIINTGAFKQRSRMLDMPRGKNYYSLSHEMAARAFENFALSKLNESGQVNDFIVNYISNTDWNGSVDNYPYPIGGESKAINDAFQNLFDTIQTRTNEKGQDVMFQIIGETGAARLDNARTVLDNLTVAKEMDAKGRDEKRIWLATGWQKGGDEKWRTEIPDGKLIEKNLIDINGSLFSSKMEGNPIEMKSLPNLSEFWDNDKVFKIYPELKDIKILIAIQPENKNRGSFGRTNEGKVIKAIANSTESATSIITHEIQHAIQDIEGFAKGGSPDTVAKKVKELEAGIDYFNEIMAKASRDGVKELYNNAMAIRDERVQELLSIKKDYFGNKFTAYGSLAGEVESRNAERRRLMSEAERMNQTLSETEDVSEKDKIYLKGEIDRAMSLIPPNNGLPESVNNLIQNLNWESETGEVLEVYGSHDEAINAYKEAGGSEKNVKILQSARWGAVRVHDTGQILAVKQQMFNAANTFKTFIHEQIHAVTAALGGDLRFGIDELVFASVSKAEYQSTLSDFKAYEPYSDVIKGDEYLAYLSGKMIENGEIDLSNIYTDKELQAISDRSFDIGTDNENLLTPDEIKKLVNTFVYKTFLNETTRRSAGIRKTGRDGLNILPNTGGVQRDQQGNENRKDQGRSHDDRNGQQLQAKRQRIQSLIDSFAVSKPKPESIFAGSILSKESRKPIKLGDIFNAIDSGDQGVQFAGSILNIPETITIDGKTRPTRNSNGQFIHPTLKGIQNFWKWFGNSVVTVDGKPGSKPLVVYHGTSSDFGVFDKENIGKNFKDISIGYYFTNGAKPDINNGIPYGNTASEYAFNSQKKGYSEMDGANVMPVYLKIKTPLRIYSDGWYSPVSYMDQHRYDIANRVVSSGHDGVIIENKDKDQHGYDILYVVFNPTQIKSATGNRGSFDPNNPDINFMIPTSVNPEVEKSFNRNYGAPRVKLWDKIIKGAQEIKKLAQHFKYVKEADYPTIYNKLRLFEAIPEFVRTAAYQDIRDIVKPIIENEAHWSVYQRVIILKDLLEDVKAGMFENKEALPMGYKTEDEIRQDLRSLNEYVANNKPVEQSLIKRHEYMTKIRKALVENGLLPKEVLQRRDYFHHQVLEYMAQKDFIGTRTSSGDVRLHRKGWQIGRTGSIKDYNTNYLESEFEVIAQSLQQLEVKSMLDQIRQEADISDAVKALAENEGETAWTKFVPEGYTLWYPKRGTKPWYAASQSEKLASGIMESNDQEQVNNLLTTGTSGVWVIKNELASQLDEMKVFEKESPLSAIPLMLNNSWKVWTLINPFRFLKYNFNNMSGDLDIVLASHPAILKKRYAQTAAIELRNSLLGRGESQDVKEALRQGVITSGITIQELPEINNTGVFKSLTGENNLVQKYWQKSKDYSQFRENMLRLASYKFFKDQLSQGRKMYGVSNREAIDGITDPKEKAAKLSRELIGDYGNLSQAGQWLRKYMIPFFSWMEINAPRYVRLIQNAKYEEGANSNKAAGIAGIAAWKTAKLAAKMSMFYVMVNLWNHIFFHDEEEELSKQERRQLHLILGRREDGSIMTMRISGAFADMLSYFGLEDAPEDIQDIAGGKKLSKQGGEALNAFINKIGQGVAPIPRTAFELISGRALYPDITKPGQIRDRAEHATRFVSMEKVYKLISHKPMRGLGEEAAGLLLYQVNPGEAAYYAIRQKAFDYLNEKGIGGTEFIPKGEAKDKSNALYYYKQSLKLGDQKLADYWYKKYLEHGGTLDGMKQSIKLGSVDNVVPKKEREGFFKSLDKEDKELLEIAEKWYDETYNNKDVKRKAVELQWEILQKKLDYYNKQLEERLMQPDERRQYEHKRDSIMELLKQ